MRVIKWIGRAIKAILFGALCGAGAFVAATLVFGILQLFCGWSKESTDTIIGICTVLAAIWGVYLIIRIGIEDDQDEETMDACKRMYKNVTGEEYTHIPPLESFGTREAPKSTGGEYIYSDAFGIVKGVTHVNGNGADHYSTNGYSASFRSGNDVVHYGTDGYHGRSYVSEDGKTIRHYGKDHMPSGYSRKNEDGSLDHFDEWGMYKGSSKEG